MKTLDQVEARIPIDAVHTPGTVGIGASRFMISQPGSYYLTANVIGFNVHGIVVNASHVTVDLNGFAVDGDGAPNIGILVNGAQSDIEIRNGTIRDWNSHGVNAFSASNVRLVNLRVVNCLGGSSGIVLGTFGEVRGCLVDNSGYPSGAGISVGAHTVISDCLVRRGPGDGIRTGDSCVIRNCTASANNGSAASSAGINAANKCSIIGCFASGNTTTNGTVTRSTGVGINAGHDSLIKDSSATGNTGDGIQVGDRSQVVHCVSNGNGNGTSGSGIATGLRALVRNCVASDNQQSGIVNLGASLLLGNSVESNGIAGIDSSGSSASRIEANMARNNVGTGILAASNDVVVRNYSFSNTPNYNPTSGTNFAPIQTPSTATNPFANF